jgi:hypothetical protein
MFRMFDEAVARKGCVGSPECPVKGRICSAWQ